MVEWRDREPGKAWHSADDAFAAVARAEYERRRRAWQRMVDDALPRDRPGLVAGANADLFLWAEIIDWLELLWRPRCYHACARSVLQTAQRMEAALERTGETAALTQRQVATLFRLRHRLRTAAIWAGEPDPDVAAVASRREAA